MSADAQAIGDRIRRIGDVLDHLKNLSGLVNLSEIPQAIEAFNQAQSLTANADVSDPATLRVVIDAWLTALREAADVTKTETDDNVVEVIGQLRTNLDWAVDMVAAYFEARALDAPGVNVQVARATALGFTDIAKAVEIARMIYALIEFFRSQK